MILLRSIVMAKIENHYGMYVSSDTPTTDVVSNHDPEWLYDEMDSGIDLEYESLLAEYESDPQAFFAEYCVPEDMQDDFDFGEYASMMEDTTYLIGSWHKVDGQYEPDESGEYAAICGTVYTQVVYSRFVQPAPLCSPCYPGQCSVDGDQDSGDFLAYTLPPSIWGSGLTEDTRLAMERATLRHHLSRVTQVVTDWLAGREPIRYVKQVTSDARAVLKAFGDE
jgi:hypothetical protein